MDYALLGAKGQAEIPKGIFARFGLNQVQGVVSQETKPFYFYLVN